ncbi:MAG: sigma-54-dependent Fis family transcriptional regulator, partial [Pseudomonadota bacterium]|nr:sigma-54-dependent Fis family transcriptional regulator [Pseudomonadota bacterium]
LLVVIRRAMETSRLRRENSELKRRDLVPSDMIGSSTSFKALKSLAPTGWGRLCAPSAAPTRLRLRLSRPPRGGEGDA